ncbi:MAG: AAA family ATPase [Firmicutes bacterium]|nr:AAA family ATPase [Bacillota bacterium]
MAVAALTLLAVNGVNIMPWVLLSVVGFIFVKRFDLMDRIQGGVSVTNKPVNTSQPSFDSIGGQNSAKREVIEALELLVASHANKLGVRPLGGILLEGPPGTGKTLMARAAASYTDSVFVSAAGSEFIEMYAGVGAKRVRQLFADARKQAKQQKKQSAVIFIDELDVVGGKRGKVESHLEYDQTLNQLLVELDGIEDNQEIKIFVLGATNRADLLDDALMRPGRFDRIVEIGMPDSAGRLEILKIHAQDKPLAVDVDLQEIAQQTYGFSGAHLANLVNEAAIKAMRKKATEITAADFLESIDKVQLGETKEGLLAADEKKRVAIHETGHALISEWFFPGSVSAVTIVPRAKTLGFIRQKDDKQPTLQTQSWLEKQISVLLAGAVAEEITFGERSTGAANDFQRALSISENMIGCGLSELGVVDVKKLDRSKLQAACTEIIERCTARVRKLLLDNRDQLNIIAADLTERERLTGEEFRTLMRH